MSSPVVKIDGKIYPIDEIIDRGVYAKKSTILYRNPGDTSGKFQVAKGGYIGKVYSWNTRTDGIWLMFTTNSQQIKSQYPLGNYYVKVDAISDDGLSDQGVKTSEQITKEKQKAEEEANKSTTDKIIEGGIKIAGLYIAGKLIGSFFQSRGNS